MSSGEEALAYFLFFVLPALNAFLPAITAYFIDLAIKIGSFASAIAVFIKTPSHPNSMAIVASDAVPTPASTLTGEIQYTKRPLALSSATGTSATTSNYFSEFCYNALFNACMIEANYFIKDFNTIQVWEGKYKNSIDGLRNQARRTRQDDMESPASPAGGPNPVLQGTN